MSGRHVSFLHEILKKKILKCHNILPIVLPKLRKLKKKKIRNRSVLYKKKLFKIISLISLIWNILLCCRVSEYKSALVFAFQKFQNLLH